MTIAPSFAPPTGLEPSGLPLVEGPGSRPSRVLYVEDDAVNAMLMQGILELRQGSELLVARTGAEARRLVAAGGIDLVLCDLRLPDISGGALLPELRAAGLPEGVPAVLVTADSEFVAAQLARRHGYDGHWTKPLDVAATLRSLDVWLTPRPASR